MKTLRIRCFASQSFLLAVPQLSAHKQDFSKYRGFQTGNQPALPLLSRHNRSQSPTEKVEIHARGRRLQSRIFELVATPACSGDSLTRRG